MVSCQNRSGSVKHAVVIRGKNTKIALRELNRWDSNDVIDYISKTAPELSWTSAR